MKRQSGSRISAHESTHGSMHQRPVLPTPREDLEIVVTDDGSRTIRLKGTDITFHSESGAMAESELVFLKNSDVQDRLQLGLPTRVLEIGFGTGLNFWITASLACRTHAPLDYVSVEPHLMSLDLIQLLEHGRLDLCQPGCDFFLRPIFEQQNQQITRESVSFQRMDNLRSLRTTELSEPVDAIYHDPFSPQIAPELWSADTFSELRSYLKPAGRLVTYCVKSSIQRTLKDVGFRIEKTRGPIGGKREVLIAINDRHPQAHERTG